MSVLHYITLVIFYADITECATYSISRVITCADINECVPLNPCSGDNLCKNSIGNYSCFLPG